MTIGQNQHLAAVRLREPGVDRRVNLIIDRGHAEHVVPGTGISLAGFQRYQARGRQLQAQAMAAGLLSLGRSISRLLAKATAGYRRSRAEAEAIAKLNALDNRLLEDIGISRGEIPAAVAGLMKRESAVSEAPVQKSPQASEQPHACNQPHARDAA